MSCLWKLFLAGSLVLPVFPFNKAWAQQQGAQGWDALPLMNLEQVYRGPLRDTVIQRWRDPVNSIICYIYLPISAPLAASQPGSTFVQYGPNTIGNISCVNPTQLVQLAPTQQQAAPAPAPPAAQPRPATPPATPPTNR
ncbi:MAG: hypothetical protein INF75_06145 [Roseomonas sp.]|nr:hypothetical protein [Roseomonas sp.]MCA3327870.1 hypothetical protein [Roseomonas sp.]MCA3331661.1 hypothetical protein [Roseomonas sp.]MCA3333238.1 hypothetical protein [Roseomonas sp.]MCA3354298.1 hypothetical protein [Roseomonas sp.]